MLLVHTGSKEYEPINQTVAGVRQLRFSSDFPQPHISQSKVIFSSLVEILVTSEHKIYLTRELVK